ncbi:MAG: hypothetical protein C4519_22390 [Desulfobacteraceae bacterium]|nr:MAG: hypothetical protein C4519_22390 [Desulfobacteraceae bacterium]
MKNRRIPLLLLGRVPIVLIVLLIAVPTLLAAERMAVMAASANVRSGPSLQHELLWQVEKYHPLLVVEKKGDWCRFKDFEGDQGWIKASLLDKTNCVIVKVQRCNVRTGPGAEYEIAFNVDKGIPFKVLQTRSQWMQVQHADGDKGWIFNALVW